MGYYDEYSQENGTERKGRKGRAFLASIAGAVIGGLIVVFAIPTLSNQGLLPYNIQPNQYQPTGGIDSHSGNISQQQVSYDVNTDTTKAIDKAAEAVVGINNIQRSNFWSDSASGEEQAAGTGSGVIYKRAGNKAYVVTNQHVVEGATHLEVTLTDGTKFLLNCLAEIFGRI